MAKNTIVIILVVVMFAVAGMLIANHYAPPGGERGKVLKEGPVIPVVCTNPDCGAQPKGFRARPTDNDWPKVCPECSQQTLYRAVPCPKCDAAVPWKPDEKGRILCPKCGHWLNPPPEGGQGAGANP